MLLFFIFYFFIYLFIYFLHFRLLTPSNSQKLTAMPNQTSYTLNRDFFLVSDFIP